MPSNDTFASRQADYDNFAQRSQWIAGGVVAVLAVSSQLLGKGCDALAAAVLTAALTGGACAAWARVEFAWATSKLALTRQQARAEAGGPLPESAQPWPGRAWWLMVVGLLLLGASGVLLVVTVWVVAL